MRLTKVSFFRLQRVYPFVMRFFPKKNSLARIPETKRTDEKRAPEGKRRSSPKIESVERKRDVCGRWKTCPEGEGCILKWDEKRQRKSALGKVTSRCASNTFNIVSLISLDACLLCNTLFFLRDTVACMFYLYYSYLRICILFRRRVYGCFLAVCFVYDIFRSVCVLQILDFSRSRNITYTLK